MKDALALALSQSQSQSQRARISGVAAAHYCVNLHKKAPTYPNSHLAASAGALERTRKPLDIACLGIEREVPSRSIRGPDAARRPADRIRVTVRPRPGTFLGR